jgi:hypothetical protein
LLLSYKGSLFSNSSYHRKCGYRRHFHLVLSTISKQRRDKRAPVQRAHCITAVFAVSDFDCCPHPHPEASADFAFASSAQQASVSTGAGPPQKSDFSGSLRATTFVEQTPVSGSTSWTALAASRSPARNVIASVHAMDDAERHSSPFPRVHACLHR